MIKYRDIYLPLQSKVLSFVRRLNIHSALAVAGILGPLALVAGDLGAASITPYYSLIKNSISSLALSSIGWLQTIGFLALGLLIEIFTAGLLYNVKRARWFHLGIAAFVIFGFGMLCIGAFNTDIPGGVKTIKGTIHGLATMVSFSLFPIAILLLGFNFKKDPEWRHMYRYSIVTCILSVVFGVALRFFKDGANYFGLVERILVANMIIWIEVMAVNLFRLSLKRRPRVDNEAQIG